LLSTGSAEDPKGRVVIGPKQTVEQYLTYWLENVHRLEIERTSLDRYRTVLRVHLVPAFGKIQLSSLTRERIQVFLTGMFDDGYAPATVGIYTQNLDFW